MLSKYTVPFEISIKTVVKWSSPNNNGSKRAERYRHQFLMSAHSLGVFYIAEGQFDYCILIAFFEAIMEGIYRRS